MVNSDVRVTSGNPTPDLTPQSSTDSKTKPDTKLLHPNPSTPPHDGDLDEMEELSPMRTHEQQGYDKPIADRMCQLVDDSDDDGEKEATVNHEKLERKELKRQKTHDKPNRMRDRLKRTVSKAAE